MTRIVLETDRLRLIELSDAEAAFVAELLNTDGFLRFIGDRGVRTPADALRYMAEGPRASYDANGHGLWKMVLRSNGQAVGMSGLVRRDVLPHPDLGYALLPEFTGRGLASEAGAGVLGFGFGTLRLPRILAIVTPANAASARVLTRLGMRRQGRMDDGEPLDVYGIDAPAAATARPAVS